MATFSGGQNLNFAIPSNYLNIMLGKIRSAKPLSEIKSTKGLRSILSDLGGRSTEGVVGGQLTWAYKSLQNGMYSLSLRNQLRENVKNVHCLVIFYDNQNNPIDVDIVRYEGIIPAGLAKRVTSMVDGSVQQLTTELHTVSPQTEVEFRILAFEITD